MEKKRDISSLVMRAFAILLCLNLLAIWFVSNMYARYTTTASDGDSARVAAYVFNLTDGSNSQMLDLEKIRKPGNIQEYHFTVTSKRGSVISEVSQSYTIKLEVEGSMPITCEIREQNESGQASGNPICKAGTTETTATETATEAGTTETTAAGTDNAGSTTANIGSSSAIKISAAEDYTRSYTLTVTWPEAYNNEKYASASGTSAVTLTVDAQQLD